MVTIRRRPQVEMLPDVEAERLSLAVQLEGLDAHEWEARSLCSAWTVHEVVAHLTLSTRTHLATTLLRILRARGDFDLVEAEMAHERARQFSSVELIAQLRAMAGVDRRFALAGRLDPLVDILVHGQDILRPLGRERVMPGNRVAPALEHVWHSPFLRVAKRFRGIRFLATDTDWSQGEGAHELRGAAGDLLLVATGRRAGLAGLHGSGVDEAAARLQTPS